jgi:hypothetical protein
MPQALCLPRLLASLRHMSSFACRVWQRERRASAWMTTLDGLLGTNVHGLGRQDAHPPPAHPRCQWPRAGVANTFSNPLMPNVPNVFAPWTYDEILITVPAQWHTPVARPKLLAHRQGCERRVGGQPRSKRREAVGAPLSAQPVAHEVPAWGGRSSCEGNRSWREDGCGACAPAMAGRPASARDDKEVI